MPSRKVIAIEKKSVSRFKTSKDRLGANVADDFKLKPVIMYYYKNPRALKNYAKFSHLCVLFCFVFVFLGLHLQHMEVPRLGVEMEL